MQSIRLLQRDFWVTVVIGGGGDSAPFFSMNGCEMSADKQKDNGFFRQFGEYAASIEALRGSNGNFDELCEDWNRVAAAISFWSAKAGDEAAQRAREFHTLAAELKQETVGIVTTTSEITALTRTAYTDGQ